MEMTAPLSPRKRARRLAVLRRRAEHLERRITDDTNRQADHDLAEATALRWAIAELEQMGPTRCLPTATKR